MILNGLNYDALREHYLLASTSNFLYRKLLREPSVVRLATEYSAQQLAEFYRNALEDAKSSLEGRLTIYAIVVAASSRDCQGDTKDILNDPEDHEIEWLGELKSLSRSSRPASTLIGFDNVHMSRIIVDPKAGSTTNASIHLMKPKLAKGN